MPRTIKEFADGSYLEYAQGRFDDWCIFLVEKNSKTAPRDINYFTQFQQLAKKYTGKKIYDDFVVIYDQTNTQINSQILIQITELSKYYRTDTLQMDKLLTIIYAGMIAEENKENAILKKRIKRLGMHQLLIENQTPEFAASFSRGKKWKELDKECTRRKF